MYGNTVPSYSGINPKEPTKRIFYSRVLALLLKKLFDISSYILFEKLTQIPQKQLTEFIVILEEPLCGSLELFQNLLPATVEFLPLLFNTTVENYLELQQFVPAYSQLNSLNANSSKFYTLSLATSSYSPISYIFTPSSAKIAFSSGFFSLSSLAPYYETFKFLNLNELQNGQLFSFQNLTPIQYQLTLQIRNINENSSAFMALETVKEAYTSDLRIQQITQCQTYLIL